MSLLGRSLASPLTGLAGKAALGSDLAAGGLARIVAASAGGDSLLRLLIAPHFGFEVQACHLAVVIFEDVDNDRVFPFEGAFEQFLGERVFDALLDRTTQRTCTVIQVATLLYLVLF